MFTTLKKYASAIKSVNEEVAPNSKIFQAAEKLGSAVKSVYNSSPADLVNNIKSGAEKVKNLAVEVTHKSPADITEAIVSVPLNIKTKLNDLTLRKITGLSPDELKAVKAIFKDNE